GLWLLHVVGYEPGAKALDRELLGEDWLASEVRALWGRGLKRLENSARSSFALGDSNARWIGVFLPPALPPARPSLLRAEPAPPLVELTAANFGAYRMGNGLSRLETRFLGSPAKLEALRTVQDRLLRPAEAESLGLATECLDEIDWDDALRVALEERAS